MRAVNDVRRCKARLQADRELDGRRQPGGAAAVRAVGHRLRLGGYVLRHTLKGQPRDCVLDQGQGLVPPRQRLGPQRHLAESTLIGRASICMGREGGGTRAAAHPHEYNVQQWQALAGWAAAPRAAT